MRDDDFLLSCSRKVANNGLGDCCCRLEGEIVEMHYILGARRPTVELCSFLKVGPSSRSKCI